MNQQLADAIKTFDVDYFGVADMTIDKVHAYITKEFGEAMGAYPRAVSLGIALNNEIVDSCANHNDRAVMLNYEEQGYFVVNDQLNLAAFRAASFLQRKGFRAFPVQATALPNFKSCNDIFPHKIAARYAGHGWIGKSSLLVTKDHGPRVRFITILTDAPLTPTCDKPMESKCGNCRMCVDACPVQAHSGRAFDEDDPIELRYERNKCEVYLNHTRPQNGMSNTCGLCVYVCPHGRKRRSASL